MLADITIQDKKGLTELVEEPEKLTDEQKKSIAMAEDILRMIHAAICRKNIFLEIFAKILIWTPVKENILLETDGKHLFYQPERLIRLWKQRKTVEAENLLLHIICHGILGHFSLREELEETKLADAVLDHEAERFLKKMNWVKGSRGRMPRQNAELLRTEKMGARSIYHLAGTDRKLKQALSENPYFEKTDHHEIWNRDKIYHLLLELPEEEGGDAERMNAGEIWKEAVQIAFGEVKEGEKLARKMEYGQPGRLAGTTAGETQKQVSADAENKKSYREILERFFRDSEGFREREDSIDKMLYTYGFAVYEDAALIEPEECSEFHKLHTVAIAIDTSGSCTDVMGRFLRETKNILRDVSENCCFEQILVLQCDSRIQKETVYCSPEELPETDSFVIRGYGGTDFRPVFRRLTELQKKGTQVDCLIYMTDGYGDFPEKKPEYPTILVLSEENKHVPEWAEKTEL